MTRMTVKIIANLVIRNEADRFLTDVLENLTTNVNEIVITDDGSTDNSVEIARQYTKNVYVRNGNSDSLFEHNEGMLRQHAWNNLSTHANDGDWVLCIDADELLYCNNMEIPLETWLNQKRYNVLGIKFFHMWNETQYRVDKAWAPNYGSRLFRFKSGGEFPQRKLACGSEPSYVQDWIRQRMFMADTGLRMKHLGYLKDEDKQMKYDRYMKLDHGDFHSLAHIESIIDTTPTLVDWV